MNLQQANENNCAKKLSGPENLDIKSDSTPHYLQVTRFEQRSKLLRKRAEVGLGNPAVDG